LLNKENNKGLGQWCSSSSLFRRLNAILSNCGPSHDSMRVRCAESGLQIMDAYILRTTARCTPTFLSYTKQKC